MGIFTRKQSTAIAEPEREVEVEIYSGTGVPNIADRSDPKGRNNVSAGESAWMQKNHGRCPDCGAPLFAGPEGGGSQNCPCSNPECRSEFNHGGFFIERNGKMSEERRKWYQIPDVQIAMSEFARKRHKPDSAYSYFQGTEEELLALCNAAWNDRAPGDGRTDLSKVVLISVDPSRFVGTTVKLRTGLVIEAAIGQRQKGEDPFVSTLAVAEVKDFREPVVNLEDNSNPYDWKKKVVVDPVNFAKIVLYSKDALLENNGTRSSDAHWEIVAIIASEVEKEPMHPLAMARNFLQKPGGTFAPYTAEQFAEAIYYWSQRVTAKR